MIGNIKKESALLLVVAAIELAKQDFNNYIAGSKNVNISDANSAFLFLKSINSNITKGLQNFDEVNVKRKQYKYRLLELKERSKDFTLQELAKEFNLSVYKMQGYLDKNNLMYKNKKINKK